MDVKGMAIILFFWETVQLTAQWLEDLDIGKPRDYLLRCLHDLRSQ